MKQTNVNRRKAINYKAVEVTKKLFDNKRTNTMTTRMVIMLQEVQIEPTMEKHFEIGPRNTKRKRKNYGSVSYAQKIGLLI
ncbi:hypothetical protein PR048_023679 [Dryococelus australis]|uniref:Uncharacterized protein n=1 Tax=Dryococelus australis TaxID=614101 RepID=A0ABQ9GUS3_9NEOP|nr:hypothetical protein PR048_023679 [Dryococelus australis]